jgi:hypothetical protein
MAMLLHNNANAKADTMARTCSLIALVLLVIILHVNICFISSSFEISEGSIQNYWLRLL